ncbi:type IIL restriction-modification enzyme MmeI [Actinoplanes sp. NPDC051470]|uniref:Eco57I restriction-modification methylase domain-containing protein n=1 Tax=Actinoplanes sp. NPDC051470 TaxID=3157224 RepID=UPI00343FE555
MCRHHEVELGLATDGRFWTLVWAPRGGATTMATFDTVAWPEAAERDVVRAFRSLLHRHRFFAVPDDEKLVPLLRRSLDNQEEITEALGVQVRQAVELLVAAFGRIDVRDRALGGRGLQDVDAHEVYRGAVSVMMRIVFLLFAEERRLLPADTELYATAYSAGRLCAELEQRVTEGSEEDLEHSTAAWQRLIALFNAVYYGVDHPRLTMHGHDGSLFDPAGMPWLPLNVDDRTVLHMLRAVQFVQIGRGAKTSERRTVSFRTLDVEQIGYVYEGLLSFEGFRADEVTVGLIGKGGLEDEVRLTDLETLAAQHLETSDLAAAIAEKYKDSKIGSPAAVAKRLYVLQGMELAEARKKLLAVTGGDYELAQRLLPFCGLIRTDLRDLPVVVLPGALFITESALRRNSGTHYTPRKLAKRIVDYALEPLVQVAETLPDGSVQRRPKTTTEILALKVADIAMGSAAFLVAAARFLGENLLEAALREKLDWTRDYRTPDQASAPDADEDPVVIEARRQIIEHCLYGVDINPMAVEMAKLSLWLVSMDPQRPFTFLDDRLVAGDSLLGVGNVAALAADAGRDLRLDRELQEAKRVRVRIGELPDTPQGVQDKRELLDQSRSLTRRAADYADLIAGSWLASVTRGQDSVVVAERTAEQAQRFGRTGDAEPLLARARSWLALDLPAGAFERRPLHWAVEFPEVFEAGGFDAIIGNPPFLGGQKLTGALGTAYREHLVHSLGRGVRGSADLVAYFVLRAHQLLNPAGRTGLIATNTLAQGDTREVGLDQVIAGGATLIGAVKSERWPSRSAALEFCAIWTSRGPADPTAPRLLNGVLVAAITPALDPASRATGNPHRLAANTGLAFQGSIVLGLGFTMSPEEGLPLIEKDERNREVLLPYLNGQDLNSRPDHSGSRLVINFHDWPENRARTYPECYDQIIRLVKPEREANKYSKTARERWWLFERSRPELYAAIAGLKRVIAITRVSKTVMPVLVPTGQVFSVDLNVFAKSDTAMLALLSSSPHYWWAVTRASSMKADLRYTLSDAFETFAMPTLTERMRGLGNRLDQERRDVMLSRATGLTATCKLMFDPACRDADIVGLRELHREIDEAVCVAYGWDDLVEQGLDHGFHPAGAYTRYTVGPAVQREILDRLLELNQARYAEETAKGLHRKKAGKAKGGTQASLFEGMS